VYAQDGNGSRQLARTHPLWRVVHDKPNAMMTTPVALTAMAVNYALRNNAYAKILRNKQGAVVGYMPWPTEQVNKIAMTDGTVVYELAADNRIDVVADANMIHWQGIGSGIVGLDTQRYAAQTFGLALKIEGAAQDLFANAGKLQGVLTIDGTLTKDQREALRSKFANMQVSSGGRSLPVLEAGMKFQSIQMTADQAELEAQRRYSVSDVARVMGVPSVLINDTSKNTSWGTGIAEIKEGFATFKLRPMCKRLEAELNEKLLTPLERQSLNIEFAFDGLLRASPEKRAAIYKDSVQGGWLTPNEARQLDNMPALAGGDALYMQAQMTPITALAKEAQ
jgi:HK97 family phage portal protein